MLSFSADADICDKQILIREIQALLLEKLSIRVESVEADLFEMGILDSSALVRLLLYLEEDCGWHIPIEDFGDLPYSVASIAELIANRKWTKPSDTGSLKLASSGDHEPGLTSSLLTNSVDKQALIREIQTLFVEELYITVESVEADLFNEGILDSQSLIQLIIKLEERFALQLPLNDLELESLSSVVKIGNLVANRRRSKQTTFADIS
jgi:acyl carrier protein